MLHIHNGDSTANTAKLSAIPGEHFAFREALIEGPTPAGLETAEWRRVRARHLSESYEVDLDQCERELVDQENKLGTFPEHEEIVLWFEHDLFCQLNLVYLLDWFSSRERGKTKLSLVCVGEFAGVEDFRGLGQLTAEQLASLFPRRTEIKVADLQLANSAWQAYCSPNPTAIEDLLKTDTSALPFLKEALRAHLRRFPTIKNGLGAIENTGMKQLNSGKNRFTDLFAAFGNAEPIYGLGDAQFWLAMKRLSKGNEPLLRLANGNEIDGKLDANRVRDLAFEVTRQGQTVLAGNADFVTLNGIDLWLGGVHLSSLHNLWRWNEQTEALALSV